MSERDFTFAIQPVGSGEDGGTGHRWMATVDIDGTPAYDGSGVSIEDALADLILAMAKALAEDSNG